MPVLELCSKCGFSDATFYEWRVKFGCTDTSDAKRLSNLEGKNTRLKKLPAALSLTTVERA